VREFIFGRWTYLLRSQYFREAAALSDRQSVPVDRDTIIARCPREHASGSEVVCGLGSFCLDRETEMGIGSGVAHAAPF
jgi:hypothetical protein